MTAFKLMVLIVLVGLVLHNAARYTLKMTHATIYNIL